MKRFKEPSTWAGVAAVLQTLKAFMPQHAPIIDGLTVAAGVLAGVIAEKGAPAPEVK